MTLEILGTVIEFDVHAPLGGFLGVVSDTAFTEVAMPTESSPTEGYGMDNLSFAFLPPCLDVITQEVVCHADGSLFTYNVEGLSSCTGDLVSFSLGGSTGVTGQDFCFTVLVNDQDGFCCSTMLCVPVPDCPQAICVSDLDGDNFVGILDLFLMLAVWDTDPGGPPDFDGDDNVGVTDLFAMFGNWAQCP